MIEAGTRTTDLDRGLLLRALRSPRGKYSAERAAQLSGVPHRTVYEWQARKIWVPDYAKASPMQWSYRDLVYLRMLLWLRQKGMDRPVAAERVRMVRHLIETEVIDTTVVRSEGQGLIIAGEEIDRMTGEGVFAEVNDVVDEHDLLDPIPDVSTGPLWLPNLRRPSERTAVSPWVMAGEPCVRDTRVPTVGLWALQTQRALRPADIVRLYPSLTTEDVEDATALERRLRLRAA
jgi:uncharacterized protein (DUF433 family)